MNLRRLAVGPFVLCLLLSTAGSVLADRLPSQKAATVRNPGVRGDSTVPYLTNGYSNLGVWQRVSPYIYSAPEVYESHSVNLAAAYARQPVNNPYYESTLFGTQSRWTGEYSSPYPVGYSSRAYYGGTRQTFNLPFYGATLGFSGRSTGAVYRPSPLPIPR